jgi:hypothetical protein
MVRPIVKIAVALAFLLLLTAPMEFYKGGYRAALLGAALTVAVFTLTAYWGSRWMRTVLIVDARPTNLDARLLTGLALTTVFLSLGLAPMLLGFLPGIILSGLQYSVLFGLFSSAVTPPGGSVWRTGFWRKREYRPAMIVEGVVLVLPVVAF